MRALSKDPTDRFATACEFAQALVHGIGGQGLQDLHSQTETSLQVGSSLQIEDEDQLDPLKQNTSVLVPLLPGPVVSSIMDDDTLKMPAVPQVGVFNQTSPLPTGKKRGPVLVSRRMALTGGLIGLCVMGGGTLWYLLNDPLSAPRKLKTASASSSLEGARQPVMNPTPTPTTQPTYTPAPVPTAAPTPTPTPTPVPVPPLSVMITNIPLQVMRGNTVPVVVTTSQSGVSVTLHVTYSGLTRTTDSSPQVTNIGGQTTFSWSIPTFRTRRVVNATVSAKVSDAQGQSTQSSPVQVRVS